MGKINPRAIVEYTYTGPLAEPIQAFVAEKRRIGYKFGEPARMLRELDRFAEAQGCPVNSLPREIVLKWREKQPTHSNRTHEGRCYAVRQLGEYMLRHGYEAYIPSPISRKICEHGAFVPYIFSEDEMCRFFQQVDSMPREGHSIYQHLFYPLLFRLLYGCGLRLNEALTLKIKEVDLESEILTIRGAKFDKDRLVPMCESLAQKCRDFIEIRHKPKDPNSLLFPSPDGGIYSHSAIYAKYRKTLKNAGVSYGGRGHGPRIHDFRHTFAVHCLRKWMRNGNDVENALMYLSAYMGHVNTVGTHTYLRLTAELFPDIIAKVETFAGDIVPLLEEGDYASY